MMKKKNHSHRRSGVILLLALLLMAAITASTIGVSVVISTTTRQSKNLDNFILASLAADSGLERSLAVVKEGRKLSSLQATVAAAHGFGSGPIGNSSSFQINATESSSPLVVPLLKQGQSFSFDILKPAGAGLATSGLLVTASDASVGILDVSWVLIDKDGNTDYTGRKFRDNLAYQQSAPGPVINLNDVSTQSSDVSSPFTGASTLLGYRVTIRATSFQPGVPPAALLTNVTATPYTDATLAGVPTTIPSRISITSTGQAGSTRSIKTASILWQLPSSKLFNYVLFTEGPIISCGSQETTCN